MSEVNGYKQNTMLLKIFVENPQLKEKYLDKIDNYQIQHDDLIISAQLAKTYSCGTCKQKCEWTHLMCKYCLKKSPPKSISCNYCEKKFDCSHTFSLPHVNLATTLLKRNVSCRTWVGPKAV